MNYVDSKVKSRNRKKIENAGKKLFISNGILNTTISDISSACELERQTFYNYFEDKLELAEYINYRTLRSFYSSGFSKEHFENLSTGLQKLNKYFNLLIDRYIEKPVDAIYIIHFNYLMRMEPSRALLEEVYELNDVVNPFEYFLEGVEDGSIHLKDKSPDEIYWTVNSNFRSFANVLFYTTYYSGNPDYSSCYKGLKNMVEVYMCYFSNPARYLDDE